MYGTVRASMHKPVRCLLCSLWRSRVRKSRCSQRGCHAPHTLQGAGRHSSAVQEPVGLESSV